MKERIKNIMDIGKKHRGITELCAGVAAAAILGVAVACNMGDSKINPPQIKVTLPVQKTEQRVSGQKADSEEFLFVSAMKQTSADKVPKVDDGTKIKLNFDGKKPDKVKITNILLADDGEYKYNKKTKPEENDFTEENGIYTIAVKKNLASMFSSVYDPKKLDIYGYCVTAVWGKNEYKYPFVLRTEAFNL